MFQENFRRDKSPAKSVQATDVLTNVEKQSAEMVAFLQKYAGASYANGLYRILPTAKMTEWTKSVAEAFPDYADKMLCFAFDWLGRSFAIDFTRTSDDGEFLIMRLEPGTGEIMEVPVAFVDFHNEELVEYKNDALSSEFYEEWLATDGAPPGYDECIGYIEPLFLGGEDVVENLEPIDLNVYWSISAQLLAEIGDSPDGNDVGDLDDEDDE